jgi:glycogen debranching enzyme
MFIAMPGAMLGAGERATYERLMRTATPALRAFMKDGTLDKVIREIDEPDILLWVVWCVQQYAAKFSLSEAKTLYGALVDEILAYLVAQKHPNLKWDKESGLVYSDGRKKPVTWMNSVINGKPVIPRSGFIVEFNALWYNDLCFHREMLGGKVSAEESGIIALVEKSFPSTFINEHNYLFDYVDGAERDWSVRPNMVIALAMPYSPLTRSQKRMALDVVTKELLTPKGLRSLSPKSEGYRPDCSGPQYERDLAYHQGAVWPWLIAFYLSAYLGLFGQGGVSFAERMLISLEEEVSLHCIGSVSEIFDGSPPFASRGAFSFLMSIAAVMYVIDKLKDYNDAPAVRG